MGKAAEGCFVPAGSSVPCASFLPSSTYTQDPTSRRRAPRHDSAQVRRVGLAFERLIHLTTLTCRYFPAGTSFQGGVMIPLHARMVNILPEETKDPKTVLEETLCVVQ